MKNTFPLFSAAFAFILALAMTFLAIYAIQDLKTVCISLALLGYSFFLLNKELEG